MRLRRLATTSLFLFLPLALTACGEKPADDPRLKSVAVRAVTALPSEDGSRAFTGVVAARIQSDLGFRVGGKIVERLVDAGQTVTRGQALFRIDPIDLKLAVKAQDDAVLAAQARADQTAADEARYRALRGSGAISASAYDQAKAAADAAKSQLSAAKAQAELARNASQYSVLVADADGIVTETLAEPGQVVSAGQTVARLARSGPREAVIQLPETVRPPVGSSATAILYGDAGQSGAAQLRQLSGAADPITRTFEARFVLEGTLADTPIGSTVTIRLPQSGGAVSGSLKVPLSAIHDAGRGPGLWVVRGRPEKVHWVSVTLDRVSDDVATVSGAVNSGDRVVALGAHLLREGQEVRVLTQESNGAHQ
ncbi:efflux RND transporter periplasmic adaptor subunit [Asticcacaulis excentricus]|uniref:Probable Co/Zn/Cd efflux system membrane fusion protein n=1 Tax=Asticcacaulis excentricus TaxID=78587 RepID=A0A3G9G7S6_9CAUL|nr:efflux RND transporter periplasmic adaptor subunit [Asticcacaulis excentricus]BBF82696.1 probable Co/Zn/Cd efflux system membrane fusion protein [Asticcacaulis excentricus]